MSADIITLNKTNFRDTVATLRRLADEIEGGAHGEVHMLAIAMHHLENDEPQLTTFGFGPGAEGDYAAVLFAEAADVTRKMILSSLRSKK